MNSSAKGVRTSERRLIPILLTLALAGYASGTVTQGAAPPPQFSPATGYAVGDNPDQMETGSRISRSPISTGAPS